MTEEKKSGLSGSIKIFGSITSSVKGIISNLTRNNQKEALKVNTINEVQPLNASTNVKSGEFLTNKDNENSVSSEKTSWKTTSPTIPVRSNNIKNKQFLANRNNENINTEAIQQSPLEIEIENLKKPNVSFLNEATNNTISQIKSDEFFKSQSERVYENVHDQDLQKNEVSFENENLYNALSNNKKDIPLKSALKKRVQDNIQVIAINNEEKNVVEQELKKQEATKSWADKMLEAQSEERQLWEKEMSIAQSQEQKLIAEQDDVDLANLQKLNAELNLVEDLQNAVEYSAIESFGIANTLSSSNDLSTKKLAYLYQNFFSENFSQNFAALKALPDEEKKI